VSTSHDKAAVDEYQALEILKIIALLVKKPKILQNTYRMEENGGKKIHDFFHLIKQTYLLREQCFNVLYVHKNRFWVGISRA
jgi:hypothetical protein